MSGSVIEFSLRAINKSHNIIQYLLWFTRRRASRHSSLSIVTRLRAGYQRLRGSLPAGSKILTYSPKLRPALGPILLRFRWAPGVLSSELPDVNSTTNLRLVRRLIWRYTFTQPIRLHIVDREALDWQRGSWLTDRILIDREDVDWQRDSWLTERILIDREDLDWERGPWLTERDLIDREDLDWQRILIDKYDLDWQRGSWLADMTLIDREDLDWQRASWLTLPLRLPVK